MYVSGDGSLKMGGKVIKTPLVLAYHRVHIVERAAKNTLLPIMSISLRKLKNQIGLLKASGYVFPHPERLCQDVFKSNEIFFTFDDGYSQTLALISSELSSLGIKPVCFITGLSFFKKQQYFWWDTIESSYRFGEISLVEAKQLLKLEKPILGSTVNFHPDLIISDLKTLELYKDSLIYAWHSHSHSRLSKVDENSLIKELDAKILYESIDGVLNIFAYPYGNVKRDLTSTVVKHVSRKYTRSFTFSGGTAKYASSSLNKALTPRLYISRYWSQKEFLNRIRSYEYHLFTLE